ncbi:DUF2515 domain-containing protein [Bacillus canaveralius]|uniref:DUF2515 domain-containing protein n=1 Tax=Bacillus canaveralius TaxID=1403243 RepID=UPI0021AD66E7|nr:DUF2515 domain-containing protein [Bacillus canaveralius]
MEKSLLPMARYENTEDHSLLRQWISTETKLQNKDNISRTNAYFHYFKTHPEIEWAFLASMVSRNAGWNMCDLEGPMLPLIIPKQLRKRLFLAYERANWLIFHDAFPQLLLYHYSTKINSPMFHLLAFFRVSAFMEQEWCMFWRERDQTRLLIAMIINEQNVIQQPVLLSPLYQNKVFHSLLFSFQDSFHFSSVLFPDRKGHLYGASVNGFRSVSKRIDLGKRLSSILFRDDLFPAFYEFAETTPHTGSRSDYEQYFVNDRKRKVGPRLRRAYPPIHHHIDCDYPDWCKRTKVKEKWLSPHVHHLHPLLITKWYLQKQQQLSTIISVSKTCRNICRNLLSLPKIF